MRIATFITDLRVAFDVSYDPSGGETLEGAKAKAEHLVNELLVEDHPIPSLHASHVPVVLVRPTVEDVYDNEERRYVDP